jgi:hypothetical protein
MTPYINPICIEFINQIPDQSGLERQAARYMLANTLWSRFGDTDAQHILQSMAENPNTHPAISSRLSPPLHQLPLPQGN